MTNQTAADLGTELHRALSDPSRVQILEVVREAEAPVDARELGTRVGLHVNTVRSHLHVLAEAGLVSARREEDRKSTRLNSSHSQISYAVFCLKKKKTTVPTTEQ